MFGRHGDLKPENILLFRQPCKEGPSALSEFNLGRLVISDFGLTSFHQQPASVQTKARTLARSPTYRPPECDIGDQIVSQRFDIWSLGCVLLEFATWFLAGWDSVEEFSYKRVEYERWMPPFGYREDKFFTIVGGSLLGVGEPTGSSVGMLKPTVSKVRACLIFPH